MGHVKGSDAEITYIEALSLDYLHAVGVGEFATHAVVAVHTCMNSLGSIYRQIELLAQAAYRLDVVSMVVSDKYAIETIDKSQSVIMKSLLERSCTNAYINK